jgi:hypothetical protein
LRQRTKVRRSEEDHLEVTRGDGRDQIWQIEGEHARAHTRERQLLLQAETGADQLGLPAID